MPPPSIDCEEHELPCVEAVLAGTLALMTGYSQAMQAALEPQHRLTMGAKIGDNLALLVDHPLLSPGFRQVLIGLRARWQTMSRCTEEAMHDVVDGTGAMRATGSGFQLAAPKRLQ